VWMDGRTDGRAEGGKDGRKVGRLECPKGRQTRWVDGWKDRKSNGRTKRKEGKTERKEGRTKRKEGRTKRKEGRTPKGYRLNAKPNSNRETNNLRGWT